ncbi:MAG: ribose-phosphate diphosphokinase [Bacteroides ovatus]|nr:ribose-phosphate diphosphokinase [Bacteroides ovatus]
MSEKAPFMVFSGTNSRYLAEKICASLDCPLGNMNITHFADGEFAVSYEESIRGAHVFLVQSTFPNSDNLMELLLMIDAAKRASTFSKYLGVPLVLCNKSREKANEVASMQIIGDVEGKNVVLIDDIVDTAGTITKAANIMLDAGAKSVRAIASHCVMSDPASFRVQESGLTEMVFTDSIPYAKKCPKVKQLSIADMFAETIKRVMNNESISSQYII